MAALRSTHLECLLFLDVQRATLVVLLEVKNDTRLTRFAIAVKPQLKRVLSISQRAAGEICLHIANVQAVGIAGIEQPLLQECGNSMRYHTVTLDKFSCQDFLNLILNCTHLHFTET